MKFSRALFAIILIIIVLMGALALPEFTVNVGGKEIKWPALDFRLIDSSSPWGNYRKGSGLYSSIQYQLVAIFAADQESNKDNLFAEDIKLIRRRMEAAGLYDVELSTVKQGDVRQLLITFPRYYEAINTERISLSLVQPGAITFVENDSSVTDTTKQDQVLSQFFSGYVSKVSSLLNISSIASVTIETRTALGGDVWRVKFTDAAANNLSQAVAAAGYGSQSPKPIVINVDGSPVLMLVSIGQSQDMLARPFSSSITGTELKVISSYLLGDVGLRLQYGYQGSAQVESVYGSEGKSVTGIAYVLSAVVLALLVWRRLGTRRMIAFVVALSSYVLLGVILSKLMAVTLSIGYVAGFTAMYALGALVIWDLLRTAEPQAKDAMTKYRNLGSWLFFISGVVYVSNIGFGAYQDLLGAVALMGIVMFICCMLFFPQAYAFIYAIQDQHDGEGK